MDISGITALVTGGASGLGKAAVIRLLDMGAANVVIVDLPVSEGESVASVLGDRAHFVAADVTSEDQVAKATARASELGNYRVTVHCAGRGGPVRVIEKDGSPGSLEAYTSTVMVNLIGSFNVLRLSAAAMQHNEPVGGESGVVVMTASVAAFEGQIGQIPYASSKAGVVGMTIVAARDLASKNIRVCTIAPGLFDTPLLAKLPEKVKASLGKSVPNPSRLGQPEEYALMATQIIENPMLNGETIRLDGAIRMQPR